MCKYNVDCINIKYPVLNKQLQVNSIHVYTVQIEFIDI